MKLLRGQCKYNHEFVNIMSNLLPGFIRFVCLYLQRVLMLATASALAKTPCCYVSG